MHTRMLLTALVLLPLVTCRAQAQSFTVKTKNYPAVGKSVDVTDTATLRSSVTIALGDKILKEDKKVEVEVKQFTEKVLEAGDKGPNKYTWAFSKASKGKEGEPAKLSYEGKTIVFERQGGVYKVMAEGGGVDQKDLDTLTKQANQPDIGAVMFPKNAVKVGDSWPLGKEALAFFGETPEEGLDLAKFKGQGKLVKAYKKGNQQRGNFEFTVTVPMKKVGPFALDKPIDMQVNATFDAAIDGSSTARSETGTLTFKGRSEITQNNMTFMVDIAIKGEFRREVVAEK